MGVPEAGTYHGFMVHLLGGKMPYMLGFNLEPTRKNFQAGSYMKNASQSTFSSGAILSFEETTWPLFSS